MKEANPSDCIEKARSKSGYYLDEYWDSVDISEVEQHVRYLELHAGRSILLNAEKSLKTARRAPWENRHKFPQCCWTTCLTLQRRREEIEREIEEVKR